MLFIPINNHSKGFCLDFMYRLSYPVHCDGDTESCECSDIKILFQINSISLSALFKDIKYV